MAEIHKHRWTYHPDTQLARRCIDCGLKQTKRTYGTDAGKWVSENWSVRKVESHGK